MENYVEAKYEYCEVKRDSNEKTLFVYETLMENVDIPNGIGLNWSYYASDFAEIIGGYIPGAILTALVKRGLIGTDGKDQRLNKNIYYVSPEMYDYYKNVYKTSKDEYYSEGDI